MCLFIMLKECKDPFGTFLMFTSRNTTSHKWTDQILKILWSEADRSVPSIILHVIHLI